MEQDNKGVPFHFIHSFFVTVVVFVPYVELNVSKEAGMQHRPACIVKKRMAHYIRYGALIEVFER